MNVPWIATEAEAAPPAEARRPALCTGLGAMHQGGSPPALPSPPCRPRHAA
ncbi:hypothetical protein AVAK2825_23330 [Acidovorax sp. SUPP2825]|nr:hypothetical protein AVAK2825_23330 [Acidovorax sp. SUPP2825]